MRRAVIFAHFDPEGDIPAYTRRLIDFLLHKSQRFILVSTNLNVACARALPETIEVIVRDNVGYDFMSYKTGWMYLGDMTDFDEVLIVNDSIYLADEKKLEKIFTDFDARDTDAWGLTASEEGQFHLQSFCIGFRRGALSHPVLTDFWTRLEVLSEKKKIILRYEIGLSQCLLSCGLKIEAAYLANTRHDIFLMSYRKAKNRSMKTLFLMIRMFVQPHRRCNPMNYLWDQVLARQGILKLELLKRNPKNIDIDLSILKKLLAPADLQALQATRAGW